MVLKMLVNKLLLRCTIHEGDMDRICLWSCIKVIYVSAAKLDPLSRLYGDNIRSINLKASGSLVDYIYQL